jgi:hypothetical protein
MYSTPKEINVSCDDKLVKLSCLIFVPFHLFTLNIECIVVLMFQNVILM